jgi:glycosyltransferase involved in cell wall biosynthesis
MRSAALTPQDEARRAAARDAQKPRLLFVLPIVPWPIRRNGISLRFAPVIDYLAQRYELDVLVLAEEDESSPSTLGRCHALTVIKVPFTSLPRWRRRIRNTWRALSPWGAPLGSVRFDNDRLEYALRSYLADKEYSVIVWATRHLEVACRLRRVYTQTRFVVDIVDSPALYCFRNASSDLVIRTLTRYDGWKWRRLERCALEAFDATIYISNVDAQVVRAGPNAHLHVIPNGIYDADAPPLTKPLPSGRVIGFLGHMAYSPNISAALRLAQRILPRISTVLPDVRLLIIGRDPAPEITQLAGPRVQVTGTVDDIWSYITRANVFVFPMIEGTGLQNKILEAMYAGVPVVTTSIAAKGIGACGGEQLLIADTDGELAEQTERLLRDPQYSAALSASARAFVLREFSWPAILPRYEAIVAPVGRATID